MPSTPLLRGACVRRSTSLLAFAAVTLAIAAAARPAQAATTVIETTGSSNWSGYAAIAPAASTFTDVVGSWNVPMVTGSAASDTYSATWIGIDGYGLNATTVEQTGTASQYVGGVATYYPWVEFYPGAEIDLSTYNPSQPFNISPGDSMSAQVSYLGVLTSGDHVGDADFLLTLIDNTEEADPSFSGVYGYNFTFLSDEVPALASAEWITEAPATLVDNVTTPLPLADYGTVNFTGDEAALDNGELVSISGLNNTDIDMVQNGQIVSLTTGLTNAGEDFSTLYVGPVPEPASLGMLAIGGIGLLVRRRRC